MNGNFVKIGSCLAGIFVFAAIIVAGIFYSRGSKVKELSGGRPEVIIGQPVIVRDISADACVAALVDMDLYIDYQRNPPGPNHDAAKDFEGIQRLRKVCDRSSNRLKLVKALMDDERLSLLLESNARTTREYVTTLGDLLTCRKGASQAR
ncbi:MAG TPA: hypothetical protein VFQ60_01655 [Patescibacteria group bacterium]|nr:hypothetical protein [Patescibacteria group bacterium]